MKVIHSQDTLSDSTSEDWIEILVELTVRLREDVQEHDEDEAELDEWPMTVDVGQVSLDEIAVSSICLEVLLFVIIVDWSKKGW